MKAARIVIVALSVLSLASAGWADDFQASVARVAKAQAQAVQTSKSTAGHSVVWAGGGLVSVGLGMMLWGLLHTSDGPYATPIDMSKVSSPKLLAAGAAVVAGGGALLFLGTHRPRSASLTFGPQSVTLSKGLSW